MLVCPLCSSHYEPGTRRCPNDGRRPLDPAVIEAAQGDPLLGCTIADRYVIVGRVGSGGMGTVYRAEQQAMGREVALKVLRKDLGRDPDTAARFHREARTLSQLKHSNTVTVFDFGQTPDRLLFLAMELLEGEMLSTRIKREGPLDVLFAIRVASGVLRSLDEAHVRGIIHRDLKPDNIFLAKVHGVQADESEVVKVVDFGIAKIRDGERGIDALQTQEGTVFGTPRYMSPEQAQGKPLDGRSDLYAVGVLLFHMLTGRPPFTDDDAVVVMAHHIKTVPPSVRKVAPSRPIPESLEQLVQRALAKDPSKRPQTAAEFLKLLEATAPDARALAAEEGVAATTGASLVSSRQRLAVSALVVVAAASTLIGLATMRPPRATRDETRPPTIRAGSAGSVESGRGAIAASPETPTPSPSSNATPSSPAATGGERGTEPGATPIEPTSNGAVESPSEASLGERDPMSARAPRRMYRRSNPSTTSSATPTRRTTPGGAVVTRWND